MPNIELHDLQHPGTAVPKQATSEPVFRHVLSCVDASRHSRATMAHASAVAAATGARLTVMRVLEPAAGRAPTDPVEWSLRHRDVEAELRRHASRHGDLQARAVVVDGPAAERICAWERKNAVDLTVLGASGDSDWPFSGLGGTARRVAELTCGSVLVVPASEAINGAVHYRRVMTPLDGSARSEAALPVALRIAAGHDAELLLVHAAPDVEVTEVGPLEAEAVTWRDQLRQRNERVGQRYLDQLRSRLPLNSAAAHTRVLASGDPRHALARAARESRADIIVLSSTGYGGHTDLSVGSVADYLINHASVPVLLVREKAQSLPLVQRRVEEAQAVRLPSRAME